MPVQDNGMYDLRRTARWVALLMIGLIVAEVLFAAHTALFLNFLSEIQAGAGGDGASIDMIGGAIGVYYLVVFVACIIVAGMWIYRAAYNAKLISGNDEISAGWAVGWYFIPIANFWKPYQAMKRVWTESARSEVPGYFGFWWLTWIVSNVLANVSTRMWSRAESASEMEAVSYIDLVAAPFAIVAAWLFRRVVQTVTEAQRPAFEGTTGPVAAVFE